MLVDKGDADVYCWEKLELLLLFGGAGLAAKLSLSRSAGAGYLKVQEQLRVMLEPGRCSDKIRCDLRRLSEISS